MRDTERKNTSRERELVCIHVGERKKHEKKRGRETGRREGRDRHMRFTRGINPPREREQENEKGKEK